jgi:exopolysaccharide biosynthesis protein
MKVNGGWKTFWRSEDVLDPRADESIRRTLEWQTAQPGVGWAELEVAGSGEAWRTRVILLRVDPSQVRLTLANGASPGGYEGTWTVASAPPEAVMAFNAGQFTGGAVWGWVVHDGVEYRPPQQGPLATAIIVDTAGRVRFESDSSVGALRSQDNTDVVEAFQSYPVLLRNGEVPPALSRPSPFIDLAHRDARLAFGLTNDGAVLVALTRFDALGGALGSVPAGLTVPEMSGLMVLAGARDAVLLDGGISAQLMVQDSAGERKMWKGLRRVPLGFYGVISPSNVSFDLPQK